LSVETSTNKPHSDESLNQIKVDQESSEARESKKESLTGPRPGARLSTGVAVHTRSGKTSRGLQRTHPRGTHCHTPSLHREGGSAHNERGTYMGKQGAHMDINTWRYNQEHSREWCCGRDSKQSASSRGFTLRGCQVTSET
jgi:hypothetical protein